MKRVGIKEVAQQAGVSATTVSLVLNNRGASISAATRTRVREAADTLRYTPNRVARSLRTKRTQMIGLLSDEITTTPFAVAMVEGAHDVARERGFLLFLLNTGSDPEEERAAVDALDRQQIDGVIYASMYHRTAQVPLGLPARTVFLDCSPAEGSYPAVVPDDRGGARAAVRELLAHQHRRIAFLDDRRRPVASTLRHEGYLDALSEAGITADSRLRTFDEATPAGGRDAADRVLDLPPADRPTALFCFNDRMAMGAYRAARHRGLRIPDDLSIVGYDDQPYIAADLDPPLTTIALPHYEMGRWAVETLLDGLDRPEPMSVGTVLKMPCVIVRRESVGPPPRLE